MDEKKIQMMTQLSIYEKYHQREIAIASVRKRDYVRMHTILICLKLGCILCLMGMCVLAAHTASWLNIKSVDSLVRNAQLRFIELLAILLFAAAVSYMFYCRIYVLAKRKTKRYDSMLHKYILYCKQKEQRGEHE